MLSYRHQDDEGGWVLEAALLGTREENDRETLDCWDLVVFS